MPPVGMNGRRNMNELERRALESRLENWSAWAREGRPQGRSSMLGVMREMGYKPTEGKRETPRVIDIIDAMEIEAAWRGMLESKEKRLLQEAYGDPSRPLWITCRRVGIRPHQYDRHINLAMRMLHNVLMRAKLQSSINTGVSELEGESEGLALLRSRTSG